MTLALDICNAPVEVAENIRDLGVYIGKSLDWKKLHPRNFKKDFAVLGSNQLLQAIFTIRHIEVSL